MKRTFFAYILPLFAFCSASSFNADAQTDIYVRGSVKLIKIALPQLCTLSGAQPGVTRTPPSVIARDLDLSGYFQVLDDKAYIESPGSCAEQVAYSDWSVLGTEALVRGKILGSGDDLTVQLYLHDVVRQQMVLGKEYRGTEKHLRAIAHKFSNEIMKYFTGEAGPFGSQITYSSRIGRFKELFVMDMDGSNARQLTRDRGLVLSPSFDSGSRKIVYTSYKNRLPDLFVYDLKSNLSTQITRDDALELGGKFLADDKTIMLSRSSGRLSEIVQIAPGAAPRRIVGGDASINVSPVFSPDKSEILFCSNRGGGPQIYRMALGGGSPMRVSHAKSSYCTSPTWSPKGDKIAFVCRGDGGFQLFTANSDGTNPQQLTAGGDNEDPDYSPDGRYVVFATTALSRGEFSLAMMREDGSNMKQLSDGRSGDFEPSWGIVPQ